ncbi:MAG: prolipoprotein diacylglyceryl transferase [Bacteroidota bacterium]
MMTWLIDWNPSPEIFSIGSFALRWYNLCFVAGFTIGFFIMKRFFERENLPVEWLDSLLMYLVLATIIGARLGHCLFYDWDYYSQHPLEMILPFKFEPEVQFTGFLGLASHGGAIGILIAMWLFSKRIAKKPILWVLDRVLVPTALACSFIRIGNLMNSEIVGDRTEVAWGFIFRQLGEDFARHPVQLYESIAYFSIFWVLYYAYWKTKAYQQIGRLTGLFFVLMFSARFILEYFKRSQGGVAESIGEAISTGQLLSVPFVLVGIYLLARNPKDVNITT